MAQTSSEKVCKIASDTIIFAGIKFASHSIVGGKWFENVNPLDIVAILVSDTAYYFIVKNYLGSYISAKFSFMEQNPTVNEVIFKASTLALGITLFDLILGDKHRILSNLIAIGLLIPANVLVFKAANYLDKKAPSPAVIAASPPPTVV